MRELLNVAGQTFIVSGFVFFALIVPLYFVYPPLYTGIEEHAANLLFFSKLGFFWTFAGICPIILSMALKRNKCWRPRCFTAPHVLRHLAWCRMDLASSWASYDDVPIGWWREGEREAVTERHDTASTGKTNKLLDWHWENSISRYEEISRSDE